jgi:alanyl-tRNA synthetase
MRARSSPWAAAARPSGPEEVNGVKFIGKVVDVPAKDLKGLADEAKKSIGSGVVVFVATVAEGKATVVVGVTDDLTANASRPAIW